MPFFEVALFHPQEKKTLTVKVATAIPIDLISENNGKIIRESFQQVHHIDLSKEGLLDQKYLKQTRLS
ncbi:hypothetical protein [Persicobacter psychrovividus]|uniref:Uncharacterized protein n=1 Tax=Persicobacter psychrovividus TaxID=387638 RepID=A0ABM7VAU3_9BACT|nr:hypothetical protein PEPS_00950 [Persicobacter psychrovividus]